jgi:3',5'-cyclic-AMP phosphodiesterase
VGDESRAKPPGGFATLSAMPTVALVTDVHFGPNACFDGKLRKLSDRAPELLRAFSERMVAEIRPDLVVNLGDLIEDESLERDLVRYRTGLELLSTIPAPQCSVAGNHDCIHLDGGTLRRLWGMPPDGPLYRSFDLAGWHFVVLHSHERQNLDVRLPPGELAWLDADLASTALPIVVLMHHSAAEQDLRGNRWFEHAPHICLLDERRELRALLRRHGRVVAVLNGHLHWNHLFVADGIPYVTLQSLTENIHDDAPGEPAAAYAVARFEPGWLRLEIGGVEPSRYQLELRR